MKQESSDQTCRCPYCNAPVSKDSFVCTPCRVKFEPCPRCGKPVAAIVEKCPYCGGERKSARK